MYDVLNEIHAIRDRQLTWAFRAIAVIGFFVLIISLTRAYDVGWQYIMVVHLGLYLLIIAMVILDRHLSFGVRAWTLIGIVFVKGIAGLFFWGLTGFGITGFIMCCILCTVGFGRRAGVLSATVCVVCTGMIGMAYRLQYIAPQFDPYLYFNSLSAWATGVGSIFLSAGLIVIGLGAMNKQFFAMIKILDQRNGELLTINKKLEEEIQERERLAREKMALRTKLQRAQKMEVVAKVAGGVAHDLNNVLVGAVSYPDLISMQLPADSPLRNTLEKMKRSGLKAAAIVSDLLTLVRRGVVTKKITNINLLITEYLNSPEFERLRAYHPEVAVASFLDDTLWNTKGSPVHIMKAIMNLVSNGVEAINGAGEITIVTRNLANKETILGYDDEITPGDYVVLEVIDTGSGMSQEELEKVFEPFYSKKVLGKSGTGLGMTVVWGAVMDHDGHLEIQTTKDKGTTFRIYFPASQEAMVDVDTDFPLEDYMGNGESILVVDDVIEQRDAAVALLTALGYRAKALPNGETAVRYLQNNSVDLIVLDMIMDPGMDGLDTYKEIVKLNPAQKTIIATGYCETKRVVEAQSLGIGNCLLKPFTLEKLGKTVRSELKIKAFA